MVPHCEDLAPNLQEKKYQRTFSKHIHARKKRRSCRTIVYCMSKYFLISVKYFISCVLCCTTQDALGHVKNRYEIVVSWFVLVVFYLFFFFLTNHSEVKADVWAVMLSHSAAKYDLICILNLHRWNMFYVHHSSCSHKAGMDVQMLIQTSDIMEVWLTGHQVTISGELKVPVMLTYWYWCLKLECCKMYSYLCQNKKSHAHIASLAKCT